MANPPDPQPTSPSPAADGRRSPRGAAARSTSAASGRRPLSFLLRAETLRRCARVLSLLALDLAGLFLAIFTALMIKAVVRDGDVGVDASRGTRRRTRSPFAFLVTVLLFARSGLYADRAARPGLPRDRRLAVPGDGGRR